MCQGDCGNCKANYRCCLPALAGFVSPHSAGPDANNFAARLPSLQVETPDNEMSGVFYRLKFYRLVLMFSGMLVGVATSIGAPALSWASTEVVRSLSVLAKTTTSTDAEFMTKE